MKGKMIVIVAPSGTGKSTLIKRLMKDIENLHWSVSCTTRPIRDGEINGKDYHFLTKAQFEEKIEDKDLIEWANVHGNYYGTSRSFVRDGLESGRNMLFDLDVQGCDQMKEEFGDEAHIIFIEPPSLDSLRDRLTKRATDSQEVIERRLKNAEKELKRKDDYDFKVTNDELEKAYQDLHEVVLKILGE